MTTRRGRPCGGADASKAASRPRHGGVFEFTGAGAREPLATSHRKFLRKYLFWKKNVSLLKQSQSRTSLLHVRGAGSPMVMCGARGIEQWMKFLYLCIYTEFLFYLCFWMMYGDSFYDDEHSLWYDVFWVYFNVQYLVLLNLNMLKIWVSNEVYLLKKREMEKMKL
jgi:hypothetical protein